VPCKWNKKLHSSHTPIEIYFQIKLFKEWSWNWPDELRSKLIDKLNELDSDFGQKLNESLEAHLENADEINNDGAAHAAAADDNTNGETLITTNGEKEEAMGDGLQNGFSALSVNEE
jgi:hypothetical protein